MCVGGRGGGGGGLSILWPPCILFTHRCWAAALRSAALARRLWSARCRYGPSHAASALCTAHLRARYSGRPLTHNPGVNQVELNKDHNLLLEKAQVLSSLALSPIQPPLCKVPARRLRLLQGRVGVATQVMRPPCVRLLADPRLCLQGRIRAIRLEHRAQQSRPAGETPPWYLSPTLYARVHLCIICVYLCVYICMYIHLCVSVCVCVRVCELCACPTATVDYITIST